MEFELETHIFQFVRSLLWKPEFTGTMFLIIPVRSLNLGLLRGWPIR